MTWLKWPLSQENLSPGFATWLDSNRPAQIQKLARGLKFWIQKLEVLYYLFIEQQRCWSDCADAQADLRLCCSHRAITGFLVTRLIQRCVTWLKWALSWENLSSRFPTRLDSNWSAQLKKLNIVMKLQIQKLEILYYLCSEQQRCWSDCTFVGRIWHKQVFSWPGLNHC